VYGSDSAVPLFDIDQYSIGKRIVILTVSSLLVPRSTIISNFKMCSVFFIKRSNISNANDLVAVIFHILDLCQFYVLRSDYRKLQRVKVF
jgi:hypothetical protein